MSIDSYNDRPECGIGIDIGMPDAAIMQQTTQSAIGIAVRTAPDHITIVD
jgi:hypothetical protein